MVPQWTSCGQFRCRMERSSNITRWSTATGIHHSRQLLTHTCAWRCTFRPVTLTGGLCTRAVPHIIISAKFRSIHKTK